MSNISTQNLRLIDVQAALPSDRHQRSNFIAISTLIADILLYLLTFYGSLWIPNWYGKIALAIVNAIAISRLFIIGHDACHGSLTDSKSLNAWIARIAFLPSWTPYTTWEFAHNRVHHAWTGLKGRDNSYPPFSKAEYDQLPKTRKLLEQFYRSIFGLPFFYFHTVWWNHLIVPNVKVFKHMNRRTFYLDLGLISSFALVQIVSFFAIAQWGQPESSPYLLTIFGILVPFYFWNLTMTFVTYLQHTHPKVGWYGNPQEWSLVSGNLYGTIHVIFPRLIRWIMHDIPEHISHHIDPKIPFYNLAAAQSKLERVYSSVVVVYPFSLTEFFRTLSVCKLYDFDRNCWTDFDGNPTAPPIPRLQSQEKLEV
jgi:acyl-lipid omega-6 desaturase (Delta-12 desaturase)